MIKSNVSYKDDLKYVPYHKTGIKLLDEHQMENLFPNYENLLERIEEHRKKLQQMQKSVLEKDSQYNLMYDNIFSIFGKRGAGKTSAVFTLKKMLETKNRRDIVLPIVMPEMIPRECSMIGWILSLLEEEVFRLDEKMQEKYSMNQTEFTECMFRRKDSLKREYEKVKELCFSQFYQTEWNESFSTALLNIERQTQNSFDFSKRLGRFWDLLRETIKNLSLERDNTEPLIYIIFDDVDLLPEAVTLLLSTIIKYLSHPNIIVFVTADEELLYDVIENNMNEKLGKYSVLDMYSRVTSAMADADYRNMPSMYYQEIKQKLQTARQIPRLYADKVLPPSSRYYLKTYETYEDKSMFIERVNYNEERREKSRPITLQEVFISEIDRYLEAVGLSGNLNFLMDRERFIKAYFAFWGNTSRQLVNEALILHEFISRLISIDEFYKREEYSQEKYLKSLYEGIYDFAYNSLTAMGNSELSVEEIKELLEELIVCKTGKWGIYLNYSYLREQAEGILPGNGNLEKKIQQIISLSILLFFLENILVIESKSKPNVTENRREKIHGRGILIDVLDQVTVPGESLVCKNQAKDIKGFLLFYEKLLISPEMLMQFDLMKSRKVRNYLNKLSLDDMELNLQRCSRENPKWLRSIVKILYFANEGIYEIGKGQMMLRKLNNPTYPIYDPYFEESLKDLREDLVKALSSLPKELENKCKKLEKINFDDKYVLRADSLRIFKNIKVFNSNSGELKEIETEVMGKFPKWNSGEYIKSDTYKKITRNGIGRAERTLVLLEELDAVSDRLLNAYNDFQYYKILNGEKFGDLIKSLERFEIVIPRKIKRLKEEIPISDMNKIFADITNKIGRLKWTGKYKNMVLYNEGFQELPDLEDIYEELSNCVSLAVKNERDLERAVNIIIDTRQFKTLQKYYLWSYLETQKEEPKDMRIDYTMIPYQELYSQISKELKKNDGSYLPMLLKRYIEEAVAAYVDMLMEG